mmetsp:Transcript_64950/g.205185  ORF Transcript_64950/g.205185 Transcript_64950/m.205185 type:complete len:473 (-) Transcript_64950:215-1633(-)
MSSASMSSSVRPLVSTTLAWTKAHARKHMVAKNVYTDEMPYAVTVARNVCPTRKLQPQCIPMAIATPLPRTRLGKISGRRSPGTGPAPSAKESTYRIVPATASCPRTDASAGRPRAAASTHMDNPIMPKLPMRSVLRPSLSTIAVAIRVPTRLVTPTATEASTSAVTPASRNTEVEKNTTLLMPAHCWKKNTPAPARTMGRYFPQRRDPQPTESSSPLVAGDPSRSASAATIISIAPCSPHSRNAAASASARRPLLRRYLGLSGQKNAMPPASMAVGMRLSAKIRRQLDAGTTVFTTSAPRIPATIMSWFRLPSAPRTSVGATSPMYVGTVEEEIPSPIPVIRRPAARGPKLPAEVIMSTPRSRGAATTMRLLRGPRVSDMPPPNRLPPNAPMSVLLTTKPSLATFPPNPRSCAMVLSGPLTAPIWYPKRSAPMQATVMEGSTFKTADATPGSSAGTPAPAFTDTWFAGWSW